MHFSFSLLRIKWNCNRATANWHLYARNIPNAVCGAPPDDEQVRLETCRGPWFSINWMKGSSRWFHYTDDLYTSLCCIWIESVSEHRLLLRSFLDCRSIFLLCPVAKRGPGVRCLYIVLRGYWGDPNIDGRIILRWIFRKLEGSWGLVGVDSG
jgi:hypothetical protein